MEFNRIILLGFIIFFICFFIFYNPQINKFKNNYYFNNNTYTAVIVEPREHPALELVLTNFTELLDDRWNFIIFHGNINRDYINNILNTKLSTNINRIKLINLNVNNLSIDDYNKLLVSKSFYDNIPNETFLIFQTDTLICSNYKDTIYNFIDYDYVGAPWSANNKVGNGGLSLRKKSKMLEILDKCNDRISLHNEDIFFSQSCLDKVDMNLPSVEEAKKFSIETIYSDQSFGIHSPWKYIYNISDITQFCPGLDQLYKLNKK
jgi:hypothetical protein